MIFLILVIVLSFVVFSPTITVAIRGLFIREPLKLGTVDLVMPRDWMILQTTNKVKVWKPCRTILCSSAPRASFTIEMSAIPDVVWERATKKVFETKYSTEATSKTIHGLPTPIKCVEVNEPSTSNWAVSSCVSSALELTGTFAGDASLKDAYYRVLLSAHQSLSD